MKAKVSGHNSTAFGNKPERQIMQREERNDKDFQTIPDNFQHF